MKYNTRTRVSSMKTRKKTKRKLAVAGFLLVALALWLGGCGTKASSSLEVLLPGQEGSANIQQGASSEDTIHINHPTLSEGTNSGTDTASHPASTDDSHSPQKGTNAASGAASGSGATVGSGGKTQSGGSKSGTSVTSSTYTIKPSSTPASSPTPSSKPAPTATPTASASPQGEKGSSKPDKEQKLVALTFDDGPDNRYTPAILDILKKKGIKATFFVVGVQVKKDPDVLQRIVDEGHEIGNHTTHHKDLTKLTKNQIWDEISTTDKLIKDVVGFTPNLVRAPYGAVNSTVKQLMKEKGRELVSWNVDTRDWAGTSVSVMKKNISEHTKPGGIILMHSFGGKGIKNTVDMLPDVIDSLQKKGYTFVTIDEMP
ncbi:Peptidoglycan/xylan/chitin deacetylase, PgdA/CDA1 family [Paenibacillus algorifonticola]|uniref:Peptidoglycan/xylan/chitin deacetylase, PgdA/CDA1 family n=1 Tax=Paenibacillus algorifonticola TaxID=684063 RepID=A0A1I2CH24_9BACL|nr:polysaccharide deacetylase family protein [Paenibacillus algorifonticola]SFE67679.1 Peptidoglycan/xylan/chitin deacetylase, PgdA/CDA1 family [Paenibacillus algorifonticola]